MKTSKNLVRLLVILLSFFAVQAQAAQWCNTNVSNLIVYGDGNVVVAASVRGDYLQVCNINQEWKGVTPPTCASWLGLIRSGVSRAASMIFYYNEDTACTAIPTYGSAPAPGYVMLNN